MDSLRLILFASLLLVSCGSAVTENRQSDSSLDKPELRTDTIKYSDLNIFEGDSIVKEYYLLADKKYSGLAVEYQMAEDGRWSFVYTFKAGVMHRLDVYGVNDYQHRFVEMRNGYEYHTVMYHRNGERYIEEFYDRNKESIGTWKSWDSTGKLVWQKEFD